LSRLGIADSGTCQARLPEAIVGRLIVACPDSIIATVFEGETASHAHFLNHRSLGNNIIIGMTDPERAGRVERGRELFKQQRVDEAIEYFQEELTSGSQGNHVKAHYWLAECQFSKRDYDLAMFHYDASIDLCNTDFQVFFDRGYLYQKLRFPEQAIADFTRAIELNPLFASAYHNRGVALKHLGQTLEAISDFRKAISISSKHLRTKKSLLDLLLPLAISYVQANRLEEALKLLDECVELKPTHFNTLFERAKVYSELGQLANAVDDCTLSLFQRPRSIDTLRFRASLNKKLGRISDAKADYLRVIEACPNSQSAARGLNECLERAA
jgi:tetratricopeptide (TPR) repeat protein